MPWSITCRETCKKLHVEMSPLTKRHRTNPELTERFQNQLRLKVKGDDEAMFMTNSPTIQDVLFFPQMRPKTL